MPKIDLAINGIYYIFHVLTTKPYIIITSFQKVSEMGVFFPGLILAFILKRRSWKLDVR